MMRKLWVLLILVLSTTVAADYAGPASASLAWQKTEFENQLTGKISRALSATIPPKLFILNVSIDLKPKTDSKGKSKDEAKDNKDHWTSNELAGKSGGRLFLDKLDFEAPPPTMDSDVKAEEVSLFDSISSIKADILLDKSIPEGKIELVKRITSDILKTNSIGTPEVKVEQVELVTPPPPPVPPAPPAPWDLKKWILELKLPITLLLVSFLVSFTFGVMALLYFATYKKLENRKLSVMEAQNTREQAAFQAEMEKNNSENEKELDLGAAHADTGASIPGVTESDIEGAESGFNRLKTLLKDDPEKAISLMRQWLMASNERGPSEALAVLPQILSTDELMAIFNKISIDERKSWKKQLAKTVDQAGYKVGELFVSGQIVDSLLGNFAGVDESVIAKVIELSIAQCLDIATQDAELGGMLVNLLPAARLGSFFALMPKELINEVTVNSMKLQEEQMRSLSEKLKSAIDEVRKKSGALVTNAFLEKAADLMKDLDPEKELTLLDALAKSGEYKTLQDSVRRFFPAELILKLPPKLLKACLDRLPLSQRADLICSRPEADGITLLDTIGKPGTKGRDIIDLEMNELKSDEVRKKRIEKAKTKIFGDFIVSVRALLKGSPAAAQQAEPVLEAWLTQKTGKSSDAAAGGETGAA